MHACADRAVPVAPVIWTTRSFRPPRDGNTGRQPEGPWGLLSNRFPGRVQDGGRRAAGAGTPVNDTHATDALPDPLLLSRAASPLQPVELSGATGVRLRRHADRRRRVPESQKTPAPGDPVGHPTWTSSIQDTKHERAGQIDISFAPGRGRIAGRGAPVLWWCEAGGGQAGQRRATRTASCASPRPFSEPHPCPGRSRSGHRRVLESHGCAH